MSDDEGPIWFAPKRYGYGSGRPISWQGWAITLLYLVLAFLITFKFGGRPILVFAAIAPLTVLLMVICARTTRGGWRWRWGDPD